MATASRFHRPGCLVSFVSRLIRAGANLWRSGSLPLGVPWSRLVPLGDVSGARTHLPTAGSAIAKRDSARLPFPAIHSHEGPSAATTPLGFGFVADHFDVVPVRTNDESCVVVRVVVRAQTRRTVVFATRLQRRAIESFDLLAILGRERQVKMRRLLLGFVQAQ